MLSGKSAHVKYRFLRRDGKTVWIELRGNPVLDSSGHLTKLIGIAYDITLEKTAEERIRHQAYHDALTGLPNRTKLKESLQELLEQARENEEKLAVLFLDIDRFKLVNDTKGHDIGDELLLKIAERLVDCVQKEDVVTRIGGDDFAILLKDIEKKEVQEIADRINCSFKEPFILEEEEFYTSTSIGISLYPEDGDNYKSLFKNADIALYFVKSRGKNGYQFFLHEPESILERKVKLEQALRKALENDQLELHYQPQFELNTGEGIGFEALIRWNHPEFGIIPPLEFILIAEESGLIKSIGEWVLDEACRQNKEWLDKGIHDSLRVAVNVSVLQFEDENFVSFVEDTLQKYQLKPHFLELEITESIMQDAEKSSVIFSKLKEIGVKISIDDFGTGYSSLNVLSLLNVDYVKIDKSFIKDILTNSNTASLVKPMIEMCLSFNFDMIVEGIEMKEQIDFLKQHGCLYGQGYFYSPPLLVEELETVIEKQRIAL